MARDYGPNQQAGSNDAQEAALTAALLELVKKLSTRVQSAPELGQAANEVLATHKKLAAQLAVKKLTVDELIRALEPSREPPTDKPVSRTAT